MTISNLTQSETRSLHDAYELYRSGNTAEAVRRVHDLTKSVTLPADRVGIGYYEVLWLVASKRVSEAREQFSKIQSESLVLARGTLDPEDRELVAKLMVMVSFVEAKLLIEEGRKESALTILDTLTIEYATFLSSSDFEDIRNEVQILRGILLVDARRYREAQPLLDNASAPSGWEALVSHYKARTYFELSDFEKAKSLLLEALNQEAISIWSARSHYLLGRIYYGAAEFLNAKAEFEQCLKLADPDFVGANKVFEWLESTAKALTVGSISDAKDPRVGNKPRPN